MCVQELHVNKRVRGGGEFLACLVPFDWYVVAQHYSLTTLRFVADVHINTHIPTKTIDYIYTQISDWSR
jgi:hypothetical protein